MMKGMRSTSTTLSFLLIIFLLSAIHHGFVFVGAISETLRLKLVHKYSPHLNGRIGSLMNKTEIEIIKELHLRDMIRHQMSFQNRDHDQFTRRKVSEKSSIEMPLHSGFDLLSGLYWVEVTIGTPPRSFMLAADTASDLTWINCNYGRTLRMENKPKMLKKKTKRVFRADLSSTFKPLPCSHGMCKLGLAHMNSDDNCPTPLSPCRYTYSYLGGNVVEGFFGYDTITAPLTFGSNTTLPNVTIGCTESTIKPLEGDGVLGLGFGDYSFTETVVAYKFAGKFSYCLMNHRSHASVLSYLTFGADNQTIRRSMKYTELVMRESPNNFYGVKVVGISIGGSLLNIPSQVWDIKRGAGVILDSGSTNTWLALPAYKAVMAELTKALSKYKSVVLGGIPFEFCFKATGFNESSVPRLAFHFADGGRFQPPVRNYVLNAYATDESVKCLGFVPADGEQSIIGNQMQQNVLWELDILRGTVGFAPSSCTLD